MNILGIIAEYNPFHNGHKYHINEAKLKTNADFVIVIMSGSFTQQGNIAILNKFERAKLSIECGADLVLELPTIYATSSSENFSLGAVNILNSLGCITHLAFGAECQDIDCLQNISNTLLEKEGEILSLTKRHLTKGITSARARDLALKEILTVKEYLEISKPNNILGLEYLKSLSRLNSKMQPVIIERKDANHNDMSLLASGTVASATAIRKAIDCDVNNLDEIKQLVPDNCFKLLNSKKLISNDSLFNILRYEILRLGTSNLTNIYEVAEGLENRIYTSALSSKNYNELITGIKSKRYTLGRVKRILIYILLGITKDLANNLLNVKYARILKVSNNGKKLLKIIGSSSNIPLLSNISEKHIKGLDINIINSLNIDLFASNMLLSLSGENLNKDYTNLID